MITSNDETVFSTSNCEPTLKTHSGIPFGRTEYPCPPQAVSKRWVLGGGEVMGRKKVRVLVQVVWAPTGLIAQVLLPDVVHKSPWNKFQFFTS